MKMILYLFIAILAAIIGYKIAQYRNITKKLNTNVMPIVEELQMELGMIQEKLKGTTLTEEEKIKYEDRKGKLMNLLGKFYGLAQEEINKLVNNK